MRRVRPVSAVVIVVVIVLLGVLTVRGSGRPATPATPPPTAVPETSSGAATEAPAARWHADARQWVT